MGRVINKTDYTFNKTAKTITFSSKYTGIELSQIQLITDVTNSTIIYQFNKVGYGGTLAGLVLTLTYDTTGAGFNNTDDLMIIIDESQDNTLLYSGTLTTTGSIAGVDTTDFQTVSIQVSGSWEGVVFVEGSNDNSYYLPLMVYPINEFSLVDNINEDGIYNLTTSTKFVRLNVRQLQTGSINTLIHGRTIDGPNAADVLSLAMDRTQRSPLQTEVINTSDSPVQVNLKKDSENALVLSDAPPSSVINRSRTYTANDVIAVIDTTGYRSISIVTNVAHGGVMQIFGSNDGVTYANNVSPFAVLGIGTTTLVQSVSTGGNVFSVPITTRYIRLIASTSNTYSFSLQLRTAPINLINSTSGLPVAINTSTTLPININQIGGTGVLNASQGTGGGGSGGTGALAIGGFNAPGSNQVMFPIIVGGASAPSAGNLSGITRTLLTDTSGKLLIGAVDSITAMTSIGQDQTKTNRAAQLINTNFQNGASLAVTDLTQHEGQRQIEVLAQILTELKITNRYLAELPLKLNGGLNNLDEPEDFRQDQSFFNI